MRRFFTISDFADRGISKSAVRWGDGKLWRRAAHGVYAEGAAPLTPLDSARAVVLATGGAAHGRLAGTLLGLDGVDWFDSAPLDVVVERGRSTKRAGVHRRNTPMPPERITEVAGVPCTDALQTLIDLSSEVDDLVWEQALESALRHKLATIEEVTEAAKGSHRGVLRMRRVLALRPDGTPPTESLLETLMVQLLRTIPGLPPPHRQVVILNADGAFVARVDLAWPQFGVFLELDGQHHRDQPVYDARRETAVVAATGWLCGRFTFHEVADLPVATARHVLDLVDQAQRRPLPINAS